MNLFKHRSFAFGCVFFFAILILSRYTTTLTRIIIGTTSLLAIIFLIALFLITKRELFKRIFFDIGALLILTIVAVLLSIFVMDAKLNKACLCDENEHIVVGKVDTVLYTTEHSGVYALDVTSVDNSKNKFTAVLRDDTGALKENDIVTVRVMFYKNEPITVEKGITFGARAVEYLSVESGKNDIKDYLRYTNKFFDSIFKESLNDDTYSLMSAMFLGNRKSLRHDINRDFTRIGIVHILSLSGMHISIVIAIIGFFVSRLGIRKIFKLLSMSLIILLFVAITGFNETTLRAFFMQFIFFSVYISGEQCDPINTLLASVLIICLINPFAVFSTSLLLSFLAMLGCICAWAYLKKRRRRLKKERGKIYIRKSKIRRAFKRILRTRVVRFCFLTLFTTMFVSIVSFPVVAIKFRQFSLFSFASNIIITPLLNLLIYLAPLMLLVAKIPFLSDAIAFICEGITGISLKISSVASSARFSVIPIKTTWQAIGVMVMFLALFIFVCFSKKRTRIAVISLICGILIFASGSIALSITRNKNDYVFVGSYSHSDIALFESEGRLTVFEACNNSISTMPIGALLFEHGYTEIESYIACDYNYKSFDYLDRLTSEFLVRDVYLQAPANEDEQKWHDLIVPMLEGKGVSVKYIEKSLEINGVKFDFCTSTYLPRSTKRSFAFSALVNGVRFTYLGASSFELVDYFPSDYASVSDYVIFGSYGPNYNMEYDYELEGLDGYAFLGDSKSFASTNVLDATEKSNEILYTKIKIPR
jgi:competence protein ComEC